MALGFPAATAPVQPGKGFQLCGLRRSFVAWRQSSESSCFPAFSSLAGFATRKADIFSPYEAVGINEGRSE